MTDRIHTPAQAIEAAAIEASRWLMVDAPAQTIGEAIRALADRITPAPDDVAGLVARLRWQREHAAADALTALSGQVAALIEDINRHVAIASEEANRAEAAEARVAALTAELDAARAQVAGAREAALREAAAIVAPMVYSNSLYAANAGHYAYNAILALIPSTPAHDVAQAARVLLAHLQDTARGAREQCASDVLQAMQQSYGTMPRFWAGFHAALRAIGEADQT